MYQTCNTSLLLCLGRPAKNQKDEREQKRAQPPDPPTGGTTPNAGGRFEFCHSIRYQASV